jgi:hypothetical protein
MMCSRFGEFKKFEISKLLQFDLKKYYVYILGCTHWTDAHQKYLLNNMLLVVNLGIISIYSVA